MDTVVHSPKVRHAGFAGSWYPLESSELESFIDVSLQEAKDREVQKGSLYPVARFAILPHAGLMFSQRGLAPFFIHFPPQAERVLILAPSHYTSLYSDELTTGSFDEYETPLGNLAGFSLSCGLKGGERAIQSEHAVEMVLPYLAWLAKTRQQHLSVSTALVSHLSNSSKAKEIAHQIQEDLGEESLRTGKTLVIASSDFTHYGRRFDHTPYAHNLPRAIFNRVKEDDLTLSSLLINGHIQEALAFCEEHHSTVCGLAPGAIVASLAAFFNAKGSLSEYYTSNDVFENEEDEFVAYSSIIWS
jgi:AmmeMemoRadiSam system protein B